MDLNEFKRVVASCLQAKYAEFNGRAGRAEFWYFGAFCALTGLVLGSLNSWLGLFAHLALVIPSLAVGTRRLHDTGRSGWLQVLWLIPLVGWAILVYWLTQPPGGANVYGHGPEPLAPAAMPKS